MAAFGSPDPISIQGHPALPRRINLSSVDILFVRHGQPQWAINGISQRDPNLTELGLQQSELAAKRIATEKKPAASLVVSPATRSQETAVPIAVETGLEIETVDSLLEIQMPDWQGVTEEAVIEIFRTSRHRTPEEWWEGLPGGESFRRFHDRVTTALEGLLGEHGVSRDEGDPRLWHVEDDQCRIVIVAHGGTNSVCLAHLMGTPPSPWEWEKFVLFHASFARVGFIPLAGAHVPSLRTFNDQDHIPIAMRSR